MTEEELSRKDFLRKGARAFLKSVSYAVENKVEAIESIDKRKYIRPPGAVDESLFMTLCNLCGKCWEACPHRAIKRVGGDDENMDSHLPLMDWETAPSEKKKSGGGDDGNLAADTPVIIPEIAPCYLCDPPVCSQVCEEGALAPVKTDEIKIGIAMVNQAACFAHQGIDQNCDYCYDRCPLKDKAIIFKKGPEIQEEFCTGCGICEFFCVSTPKAIKISPV